LKYWNAIAEPNGHEAHAALILLRIEAAFLFSGDGERKMFEKKSICRNNDFGVRQILAYIV
jgi:hypothetical protein